MIIKQISKFIFPCTFLWLTGLASTTTVPKWRRKRELSDFRFSQCSNLHENMENEIEPLISMRHMSINPSPIRIPGFLKIDAHFNVTSTLPENLTVRVHMRRRINQHLDNNHVQRHRHWRKVACHRKIGSCTFSRVNTCSLAKYLTACPISPTYHIIEQHFYIPYPDEDELRFLLTGQYKLKLLAHDSDDSKRIALCVEIHFTLHS